MHELRQEPNTNPDGYSHATRLGGPHAGQWVLLALVGAGDTDHEVVPVMEPRKRLVMRRYRTAEEAIAAATEHAASRVGGGWAVNIKTGRMVQYGPYHSQQHV